MAMINCPECSKEVSDRASACPNCGCPINVTESESQATQKVELTSVKFGNKKTRKKIIIGIASIIVLSAIAVGIILTANAAKIADVRKNYIANLNLAAITMLDGGIEAEALCNLTKSVWYNTINEVRDTTTDEYTLSHSWGAGFNSDFNTSLTTLYKDANTVTKISSIDENRDNVEELMKLLQSPNEEFQECYNAIDDLYSVYYKLTSLAMSPSGSLTTYSSNFNEYESNFLELYDKLMLLIPEE